VLKRGAAEATPEAFLDLFRGANMGKMLVRLLSSPSEMGRGTTRRVVEG
jgi:hypothetical protein